MIDKLRHTLVDSCVIDKIRQDSYRPTVGTYLTDDFKLLTKNVLIYPVVFLLHSRLATSKTGPTVYYPMPTTGIYIWRYFRTQDGS